MKLVEGMEIEYFIDKVEERIEKVGIQRIEERIVIMIILMMIMIIGMMIVVKIIDKKIEDLIYNIKG